MESANCSGECPADLPSSELWGREVFDAEGHLVGAIDSIARTLHGPVRAIVRTGRRPKSFIFVDLAGAVVDGEAVVVVAVVGEALAAGNPRVARWSLGRLLTWSRQDGSTGARQHA